MNSITQTLLGAIKLAKTGTIWSDPTPYEGEVNEVTVPEIWTPGKGSSCDTN